MAVGPEIGVRFQYSSRNEGDSTFATLAASMEVFSVKVEDIGEVIKDLVHVYTEEVNRSFESRRSPEGQKWPELADGTKYNRQSMMGAAFRSQPILREPARRSNPDQLYNSVMGEFAQAYTRVGKQTRFLFLEVHAYGQNGFDYPAVHQTGDAGNVPKRAFWPDGLRMTAMFAREVDAYLERAQIGKTNRASADYTPFTRLYGTGSYTLQ